MKQSRLARIAGISTLILVALFLFSAVAWAQEDSTAETVAEPGVLIVRVGPDSPAAEAGLQRGDILLRIGDIAVNDAVALRQAVAALNPGDDVILVVLHGDDEREVTVTLGEQNGIAFLGVMPFAVQVIERVDLPPVPELPHTMPEMMPNMPPLGPITASGQMTVALVIVDVVANSPAAAAGLQPEEAITAIDGAALAAPDVLVTTVRALAPGDEISLTIGSGLMPGTGKPDEAMPQSDDRTVVVTLGEHPDDPTIAYLGVQVAPQIIVIDEEMSIPPTATPRDHRFRHFQFRLPRFLPRLHEHMEEWRDQRQECQCGPQQERRWYFMPRGEREEFRQEWRNEPGSEMPFPNAGEGDFFWFDATPQNEDIIIINGSTGDHDVIIEMPAEEYVEEHLFLPNGQIPTAPIFENNINEDLI